METVKINPRLRPGLKKSSLRTEKDKSDDVGSTSKVGGPKSQEIEIRETREQESAERGENSKYALASRAPSEVTGTKVERLKPEIRETREQESAERGENSKYALASRAPSEVTGTKVERLKPEIRETREQESAERRENSKYALASRAPSEVTGTNVERLKPETPVPFKLQFLLKSEKKEEEKTGQVGFHNAASEMKGKEKIPIVTNTDIGLLTEDSDVCRPKLNRSLSAGDTLTKRDSKLSTLVEAIVKSTPHVAMSLSLKSESIVRKENNEKQQKLEMRDISIKSKRKSQTELTQSQKEMLFLELKNAKEECDQNTEVQKKGDDSPVDSGEKEELAKIVNSVKNMELYVTNLEDLDSEGDLDRTCKSLNLNGRYKSPRFVRRSEKKVHEDEPSQSGDEDEYMKALMALQAEEETDFAFTVETDFSDVCVVPTDSRVQTSTIGKRTGSALFSARSHVTSVSDDLDEEVETIAWKKGNLLGRGSYGKVWCGLTNKGELIAVKQIELQVNEMEKAEEEYDKIQEEVELLKALQHPNIVGYLGTCLEDNLVSIFMEFVPGGSIASIIARFGALEEDVFMLYTKQILKGVAYLHHNGIIHRDIKGGNIMVMHNGTIKLIDFGCAKRLFFKVKKSKSQEYQLLKSVRGTPYWMSPEIVNETGYATKSDIWSIGCTVYEMATKKPPWAELAPISAIFAIGTGKDVVELPETFSVEARDFVNKCLTRDQHLRPSAAALLKHTFLKRKRRTSKQQ